MKRMAITALWIGILATTVLAQTPRKPGAEEARIGFFAGQWKIEGEVKPFPGWPSGKLDSNETCQWFEGGFQLVCHSEGTSPMGAVKAQSIFGYSPMGKTYTYYRISSRGEGFFWEGTLSGNVWTWTNESDANGKPMKARMTVTEQSPISYTSKIEFSTEGGPFVLLEEMKVSKVR